MGDGDGGLRELVNADGAWEEIERARQIMDPLQHLGRRRPHA